MHPLHLLQTLVRTQTPCLSAELEGWGRKPGLFLVLCPGWVPCGYASSCSSMCPVKQLDALTFQGGRVLLQGHLPLIPDSARAPRLTQRARFACQPPGHSVGLFQRCWIPPGSGSAVGWSGTVKQEGEIPLAPPGGRTGAGGPRWALQSLLASWERIAAQGGSPELLGVCVCVCV